MTLDLDTLEDVLEGDSAAVWRRLIDRVHDVCGAAIDGDVAKAIREREQEVGELDDLISTSAWDLWNAFQAGVPPTSDELKTFWKRPHVGKAILILDGLSMRELRHLIKGASDHGLPSVSPSLRRRSKHWNAGRGGTLGWHGLKPGASSARR